MEGVQISEKQAVLVYTMANFFSQANKLCFDKCVVDFQVSDLTAVERTCAEACVRKQLHVVREMQSPEFMNQQWVWHSYGTQTNSTWRVEHLSSKVQLYQLSLWGT